MNINVTNWPYFAFMLAILLFAGVGAYLHIVPSDTFVSLLLVAIGIIAPSPILQHTTTSAAEKPPTNNG